MNPHPPELTKIGLSDSKIKETVKNVRLTSHLVKIVVQAEMEVAADKDVRSCGPLLYSLASKLGKIGSQLEPYVKFIVRHIVADQINNDLRLSAAVDYLVANLPPPEEVDVEAFNLACGIGVIVTPEDIETAVSKVMAVHKEAIEVQRYAFNVGLIMNQVRSSLPWADGKLVKAEVDVQMFHLLGSRSAEINMVSNKVEKKAKEVKHVDKANHLASKDVNDSDNNNKDMSNDSFFKSQTKFHAPGANHTTDGYLVTEHTKRLLADHLVRISGQVRTRFPPEPNGLLHIGHAKAININFGYAKAHSGHCILRYDDTNPAKEESKFFQAIASAVTWLGYQPSAVTHSSDYFDILYHWAEWLVLMDGAYVCHQTSDNVKGRDVPISPWRDRPALESLTLLRQMRDGLFDEGEATLRLKMRLEEGKQDPIAYRIKFAAHHRSGQRWCIYPTYDYTHCLCDSIEDVTHSLCTKEFQSRRSSYYWLCNALQLYCPVQWEYGRLNMNYTVVSKRKIQRLIETQAVDDWDDPRLFTLAALRRRGCPVSAINKFCLQMGLTGATATAVDPAMLDAVVRSELNATAVRTMVVLHPIRINVLGMAQNVFYDIDVPDFPGDKTDEKSSCHKVQFGSPLYIEQDDFVSGESVDKGFKRLTLNQPVGLKYCGLVIHVVKVHKTQNGIVDQLDVRVGDGSVKPKAYIQWVANPAKIDQIRLHSALFCHRNPEDLTTVPGSFVNDINADSIEIITSAVCDRSLREMSEIRVEPFQFERIGYFTAAAAVDFAGRDQLIFNRTVSLKEDSSK